MGNWRNNWLDYYEILEIDRDADLEEIKKKYRKLMAIYHPDSYKGEDGEEKARLLNEAYSILSDEEEKKLYDEEWDSRKNNNMNQDDSQATGEYEDTSYQNVNYDDVKNSYTEEERIFAERLALKKLIEQELEKVKLIIDAKNEIILSAYINNNEKREYRDRLRELLEIVEAFIENLRDIAKKAYELDLLGEEESILNLINELNQEMEKIPRNATDAYFYTQREIFKDNLKEEINQELINATNLIDNLNLVYQNVSDGNMNEEEFAQVLLSFKYWIEVSVSNLQRLTKMAIEFKLPDEAIIKKVNELEFLMSNLPSNYEEAQVYGQINQLMTEIKNCIDEWDICKNKILKIKDILLKYPNSHRYQFLYNHGLRIIKDSIENMNNMSVKADKKKFNISSDNYGIDELSEKGKNLYMEASKLNKRADDILAAEEGIYFEHHYDAVLDLTFAAWDKGEALEMLAKAKRLKQFVDDFDSTQFSNISDNLAKLVDMLINCIKEAEFLRDSFANEYKWTSVDYNDITAKESKDYILAFRKKYFLPGLFFCLNPILIFGSFGFMFNGLNEDSINEMLNEFILSCISFPVGMGCLMKSLTMLRPYDVSSDYEKYKAAKKYLKGYEREQKVDNYTTKQK